MPLAQSERSFFKSSIAIRLAVTAAALVIWFWTQSLIGARGLPASGIGDRVPEVRGLVFPAFCFFFAGPLAELRP
jgi:hypothetical protein